ncbi:hypothetical protein QYM36_011019 [Artemia franciscana]|uniref:Uncharacterized protein n=1 Tax=Artemia franciscana TaxID=6661 RepID=A0AA88HJ02_ARTSF|nr:hypothetical protein QYM36_011019 [Artemia franciscana]
MCVSAVFLYNHTVSDKYDMALLVKSAIVALLRKLQLYKNNIRRRAFEQFPCLACVSSDLHDEDLALYGEYLENIHEDMQTRIGDLLGMDIPIWVSIPFEVNVAAIDISLQEPFNEIQSDEIMHPKSKDHQVQYMENKLDIMKRGDLRLSLTSIEPNINKLAEKNQPQGSH